jgi:hypothetical protein
MPRDVDGKGKCQACGNESWRECEAHFHERHASGADGYACRACCPRCRKGERAVAMAVSVFDERLAEQVRALEGLR